MKNNIDRTETILDIMQYMQRPILKDRFEIFYENEDDTLVILAKDDDSIKLLNIYASVDETPVPEEIQAIFDTPEDRIVFLRGSAIDSFEKSLIEFYQVLRTFKV